MNLDCCLTYYSNYVHKQIFSVMSLNIARSQMMDKKLSVLHVLTSGGQWVVNGWPGIVNNFLVFCFILELNQFETFKSLLMY